MKMMDIFYSPYFMTPLKRLNRNSTMEPKQGIHLKAVWGDQVAYADYFPHAIFGDKGCDHFLKEFHLQQDIYDRKVLHLLVKDFEYQQLAPKTFFNHQLWTGSEDLEASIIKYKLANQGDRTFLDPLKRGIRLRLDTNALFNRPSFEIFLNSIPSELHTLIDYVEDPLTEKDWSNLGVKSASDLVVGNPCDVSIYRPNSKFFPEDQSKKIFSSYLGSDLGRWHTYCELIEKADLSETHGIMSRGFFVESTCFLTGNYQEGFVADKIAVSKLYQGLRQKQWTHLCFIE